MKQQDQLILRRVTVVDTHDGSLAPDMDLRVEGNHIVSIIPSADAKDDAGAIIVEAGNKFVVPGYLDMHAHPLNQKLPSGPLELMLANGITGFRQMGGTLQLLAQRRAGTLPIPVDAPALLAMPGDLLLPNNAGSTEAAVATVREGYANGADFVKVGLVSPNVFFAAQKEANRLGTPIVGHLPASIDVVAASHGGMKSIEHLGPGAPILVACSTDEVALREAQAKRPPLIAPPIKLPFMSQIMASMLGKLIINPLAKSHPADVEILRRAGSTFNEEKARALAIVFVADGTWQCPTLIRVRTQQFADAPEYQNDPNLQYVAPSTVKEWHEVTQTFLKLSSETRATFRHNYALQLRLVKLFDDVGVKMLAGSDVSGAAWEVPGFSLHQEFDELAKAGLSPLRVLQTTTLNGAEFLGTTATMGSVEVGKNADLVLLDANPIASAQNLHAISGVVRDGRYYSQDDLEGIKRKVATSRSVY